MRLLFGVVVFLLLGGNALTKVPSADTEHQRRKALAENGGAGIYVNSQLGTITLFGEIRTSIAEGFEQNLKKYPNISVVYADSTGGDLESALKIAHIIQEKKMTFIVDGRCFSACAQILLIAAREKQILPNSLIGVHPARTWWSGIEISTVTFRGLDGKKVDSEAEKGIRKMYAELMNFYLKNGISMNYVDVMSALQRKRAEYLKIDQTKPDGRSDPCLSIDFWILKQSQLESMGVRGIKRFWFPEDMKQVNSLMYDFDLIKVKTFMGDAKEFELLCKNTSKWKLNFWPFNRL